MRPSRLVLFLAALLLLTPISAVAGKGPPPGDTGVILDSPVEGDYFFLDKVSFDKIKSVASIDQELGEFCLDVLAVYLDATVTLNHRVEVEASSVGNIEKQGPGKVDGSFSSVDLTVTVWDTPENIPPSNVVFTTTLVDAPCELDAKLSKVGTDFGDDTGPGDDDVIGEIKAKLSCNLGPLLEALGVEEDDPDGILPNIANALAKKKSIKVKIKTGDLQINHNGFRVDPVADGYDFSGLDFCNPPPPIE